MRLSPGAVLPGGGRVPSKAGSSNPHVMEAVMRMVIAGLCGECSVLLHNLVMSFQAPHRAKAMGLEDLILAPPEPTVSYNKLLFIATSPQVFLGSIEELTSKTI